MTDSVAALTGGFRQFRRISGAAIFTIGAACSGGDPGKSTADSALERDLTLAASAQRPAPVNVELGDTATAAPKSASPAGTVSNRPQPSPTPRRVTTPVTSRPTAEQPPVSAPQTPPVAAAPVPAIAEPAPVAASGTGKSGNRSIGAGTALIAHTATQLCSLANRPGDRIVATLTSAITDPNGTILPAGTPIVVEMATAEPPADFAFRLKGVQVDGTFIPAEGTVASAGETTDRRVSKGGDKGKVATGAIVGAILGRVIGGGTKGTVIGAAGGAAAGSVMAARNSTVEHCLPAGATITVTLASPLVFPGAH